MRPTRRPMGRSSLSNWSAFSRHSELYGKTSSAGRHEIEGEEDEEGEAPPLPALLLASTRSSARIVATSVFPPAVGAE